jgi:hypothetical protein
MTYLIIFLLLISGSSIFVNADLILGLLFILGFYLIYSFGSSLIVNILNNKIESVFKRFYVVFSCNSLGVIKLAF